MGFTWRYILHAHNILYLLTVPCLHTCHTEDNQVAADFQQGADKCDAPLSSGTLLCQMELCRIDRRKRIPLQELDSDQQKVKKECSLYSCTEYNVCMFICSHYISYLPITTRIAVTGGIPYRQESWNYYYYPLFFLQHVYSVSCLVEAAGSVGMLRLSSAVVPLLSSSISYRCTTQKSHLLVKCAPGTMPCSVVLPFLPFILIVITLTLTPIIDTQSMPRPFQHVQQMPLCAAAAGDTNYHISIAAGDIYYIIYADIILVLLLVLVIFII